MAIRIVVSNTVLVRVEGTIINEQGSAEPFDFKLRCKRLNAEDLRSRVEANVAWDTLVGEVAEGWAGVKGEEGEIPFAADELRKLLAIPGLAMLAANAYLRDCGAKAKN